MAVSMGSGSRATALAVAAVFVCLAFVAEAHLLGIDVGSEYIKVSQVRAGSPIDILLNPNSRRKTKAVVGFYDGQRLIGDDAAALATRKPHLVMSGLQQILGRGADHEAVVGMQESKYFAFDIVEDEERGSLGLRMGKAKGDGDAPQPTYTAEELMAMLFGYIERFASSDGSPSRDVVITVPMYFTQRERQAMLDAADLAGLRVLGLIEENTAAAVQYGIDRVFENKTQHTLIYNMGSAATQVSVLASSSYKGRDRGRKVTVGTATMVGKGYDTTLGTTAFTNRVVEHLADAFNKEHPGKDARASKRTMAKLRKNGQKVMEVLSANEEFLLYVESLMPDVDFRHKLARTTFDDMCADLLDRVTGPVATALAAANLTVADLDEIEIVGGGVRIPAVQARLKELFTDMPLGVHLNGDESMALGAAFVAANRSTAFKVRKVGIVETLQFPIGIRLNNLAEPAVAEGEEGEEAAAAEEPAVEEGEEPAKPWTKRRSLFHAYNRLQSVKKIAFPHDHDFEVKLVYENSAPLPAGTDKLLAVYNVTGVPEAAAFAASINSTAKVNVVVQLDINGIAKLKSATATVEEQLPVEPEPEVKAEAEGEKAEGEKAEGEGEKAEEKTETAEGDAAEASEGEEATEEATEESDEDAAESEGSDDGSDSGEEADADAEAEAEAEGSSDGSDAEADAEADAEKEGDAKADEEGKKDDKKKKKGKKEEEKAKKKAKKKKPTKKVHRFPLTITEDYSQLRVKPLSAASAAGSRAILAQLDAADKLRADTEAAKNALESLVYAVRDRFEDEEEAIAGVTTIEQVEAVTELLEELTEWLYDDGEDAELAEYRSRARKLGDLTDAIYFRMAEAEGRQEFVAEQLKLLGDLVTLMEDWAKTKPQINATERELVQSKAEDNIQWLKEQMDKQDEQPPHESPVFTRKSVAARMDSLRKLVKRLARRPKPAPVKEEKKKEEKKEEGASAEQEEGASGEAEPAAEPAAETAEEGQTDEAEAEAAEAEDSNAAADDSDATEAEAEPEL